MNCTLALSIVCNKCKDPLKMEDINEQQGLSDTLCNLCNEDEMVGTGPYIYQCPITTDDIVVCGMTCAGKMYEYSAIKEWLKDHTLDPSSQQHLPSTSVVRIQLHTHLSPEDLEKEINSKL